MTMIPNCRNDEYYNEKYLKNKDKEFIDGFDWCVECAVDNFFDNEMFGLTCSNDALGRILCEEAPEYMQEEYIMHYAYQEAKEEKRQVKTYADLIRMTLLEWIEMERNELITSIIDSISDAEYERIKKEKDGENDGRQSAEMD